MLPFDELALFAKVAETKSFSAAASQLGVSSSTASDYINRLETKLGLKLFSRSTRRVELTEAGSECYEHAVSMVASAEKAISAASEFHAFPQGVLRISCPETFTEMHISPLLGKYLEEFPKVSIETSEGAHQANLIGEQFDLAIRIGRLADSTLTVRRLATSRLFVVAAPSLLGKLGYLGSPQDLEGKPAIQFAPFEQGDKWTFNDAKGNQMSIRMDVRLQCTSGASMVVAAEEGIGCACLPDWMIQGALETNRLVKVFRAPIDKLPVSALFPGGHQTSFKVRSFVDFMAKAMPNRW